MCKKLGFDTYKQTECRCTARKSATTASSWKNASIIL